MSNRQPRGTAGTVDNRNIRESVREDTHERTEDTRPTVDDLSLDDIFGLLSNRRRRYVLRYLLDNGDRVVTIDELARHVAAKENDIEVAQLSSKQRKRAYVALHQNHLRMLHKLGVIDHDKHRGTVVLRDISPLSPYLSVQSSDTQSFHFLSVAGAVSALVIAGLVGIGPMAAVPTATWAVFSTTVLLFVAIIHTYSTGLPQHKPQ